MEGSQHLDKLSYTCPQFPNDPLRLCFMRYGSENVKEAEERKKKKNNSSIDQTPQLLQNPPQLDLLDFLSVK